MLQRFYHQQSQLREREANVQSFNNPLNSAHSHFKAEYEKRVNEINDTDHNQANPFIRQIPKLTHKLNPFTKLNTKLDDSDEPVYANSHIPIYQNQYDNFDVTPKENIHRQRIPANPPIDIYNGRTSYPATYEEHYPSEHKSPYTTTTTSAVNGGRKSNGSKTTSDDPGKSC